MYYDNTEQFTQHARKHTQKVFFTQTTTSSMLGYDAQ